MDAKPGEVISAFHETQPRRSGDDDPGFTGEKRGVVLTRARARYENQREEEYSLEEYLDLCRRNSGAYATAAERLLTAIGEPELLDTRKDPRLSRICAVSASILPSYSEVKVSPVSKAWLTP